jgi:DNA-directed RNA polymerase subunit RPC12/RpoP
MSKLTNAVCFTCGLVIESPPRLSRLTNGQVCPACRERVLEELPPALPTRTAEAGASSESRLPRPDRETADGPEPESGPEDWNSAS